MNGKIAFDTDIFLKRRAKPILENDLWIASLCIENKIPLISKDVHFENIDNLTLKYL